MRSALLRIPIVLVVMALALGPETADATFSGQNGVIAFTRGSQGILLMEPDGSSVTRVTNGGDLSAAFSPDGTRIAFVRWQQIAPGEYRSAVFVVRTDGTYLHRVSGVVRGWWG